MPIRQSTESDTDPSSDERDSSVDGEWQLVGQKGWWRTSFDSLSWAFTPEQPPSNHQRIPLSPLLRLSSLSSSPPRTMEEDDCSLNPDLVGCRMVKAVVTPYETAVGFDFVPFPKIEREDRGLPPPLNLNYKEEDVADSRERWRDAVDELLSSDNEGSLSLSSSTTESARAFTMLVSSSRSSLFVSGSEQSAESLAMPATPVTKASYATVLLKNVSPTSSISDSDSRHAVPSKSLNALASSFVPSTEPSPLSSFTFPTLNPPNKSTTRLTTVKIRKDDQGFFTGVQVDDAPQKSAPLPSYLQELSPRRRSRTSKTRELVDRLRSTQASSLASKCISHSPSPICHDLSFIEPRLSVSEDGGDRDRESNMSTPSYDEDDEGWIDVGVEVPTSNTKAKRAHDLFLALTRRKTHSAQGDSPKSGAKGKTKFVAPNSEGWIEGLPSIDLPASPPALPMKPSFHPIGSKSARKKQHAPKLSTSVSPSQPTFPPPPYIMPILNPPHMPMLPPAPMSVPAPVPFYFSATAPPYHPIPLQYPPPPTLLGPSPFISAALHPMATGYASKRQMNAMHPKYHHQGQGRVSISSNQNSSGKAAQ